MSKNTVACPLTPSLRGHIALSFSRPFEALEHFSKGQAAAVKDWNPSGKPDWLDKKFYREQIQPRLAGIAIPVLVSALDISKPYATDIRRRPHPRHWLRLAELVGLVPAGT